MANAWVSPNTFKSAFAFVFPDTISSRVTIIFEDACTSPATLSSLDTSTFEAAYTLPVIFNSARAFRFPEISKTFETVKSLTKSCSSIFASPCTTKIFDAVSSTYRFEPTSSVCTGEVFPTPTFESVTIEPYT